MTHEDIEQTAELIATKVRLANLGEERIIDFLLPSSMSLIVYRGSKSIDMISGDVPATAWRKALSCLRLNVRYWCIYHEVKRPRLAWKEQVLWRGLYNEPVGRIICECGPFTVMPLIAHQLRLE